MDKFFDERANGADIVKDMAVDQLADWANKVGAVIFSGLAAIVTQQV